MTSRVSPSGTTTYTYDPLDRIDLEAGPAGSRNHDFDAGENRVSDGAGTTVSVAPGSNRLATINGVAVTLDAAGNLLADGSFLYAWDDWGNLASLRRADGTLLATYFYDANHLRTRKETTAAAPQGAGKTYFHYDPQGRLIAETAPGNVPVATYVWNEDVLTGFIRYAPSRTVYTVQTDQIGSPFQVRKLDGTVLWRWESEAFGRTAPNEDVDGDGTALTLNLRFPGQYFDAESGLHYNWHRYYSPRLGRYLSSDPIGLRGGINTYAYALNNPLRYTDPKGLDVSVCRRAAEIAGGLVDHAWVRTAAMNVGLGGNPNVRPGDEYEAPYITDTYVIDHSKDKPESCEKMNNVDEQCVDRILREELGTYQGRFSLYMNCQAYAYSVVNRCRSGPQMSPAR